MILSLLPLIKARFVDVITTGSFAPDDLLGVCVERHETDRAVSFDGLPISGMFILLASTSRWNRRGILKYLPQLLFCRQLGSQSAKSRALQMTRMRVGTADLHVLSSSFESPR